MSYKIGLVNCLIHRAFKISSSYLIFHNELEKIKKLLQKNLYPNRIIDNNIRLFLEKQYNRTVSNTTKKKVVYYKLPYIGHFSQTTKRKLKSLCEKFCKSTEIKIAYSPLKIGSFFSLKDRLPKLLQSYVVYRFTCAGCKACYIGETKRHLTTRIEEHLGKDKKSHIYINIWSKTLSVKKL